MKISKYFKLNKSQPTLDFVDIDTGADTALFIDPYALRVLPSDWAADCVTLVQSFFETVLNQIRNENHDKATSLLEVLSEPNETHLGFSKGKSRGRAIGKISALKLWEALKNSEATKTGLLEDLEDTILMIEGVSSDIISDMTTNIIKMPLIQYTQDCCNYYGIELTKDIDSGPVWDSEELCWVSRYVDLPLGEFGKLLFVPKTIARKRLEFDVDEYYNNYIIAYLKDQEIKLGTHLVKLLKDGTKTVSKKSLKEKYGFGKSVIIRETLRNPDLLQKYKRDKRITHNPLLSHEEIALSDEENLPKWDVLLQNVQKIPTGKNDATDYENAIEELVSALFFPSLSSPKKQKEIHDGRKRIDIEYTNSAQFGFFDWVARHYPSGRIFIECKNYSSDIANPELDQISGRFSPSRGKVGIIICRKIEEKDRFFERCRDTAKDDRGFILVLDDEDLIALVKHREGATNAFAMEFPLLREQFDFLIS